MMNFVLLAIDGVVYKYDTVTSELLCSFKTPSDAGLILFDKDTKLITASRKEIWLWDFNKERKSKLQVSSHKNSQTVFPDEEPAFVVNVTFPTDVVNFITIDRIFCFKVSKNKICILVTNDH